MATATLERPSSLSQELRAAATAASLSSTGTTKHLQIQDSDVPSLVPNNAFIKVTSTKLQDLKMGDLVCVRAGGSYSVRRFVKVKHAASQTLVLTAREGYGKKEPITRASLLGKVEAISVGGKAVDPLKNEGILKSFWGKLTEYGTHKPFGLNV